MLRSNSITRSRLLNLAVLLSLLIGGLGGITLPVQAAPTELFFSEYIEGTSNNKALEIYNGTGVPVDLAAGGYNVQMFFNGSASAGLSINLTGVVANGDVYVLTNQSASQAIKDRADLVTTATNWYNGDDAVVLRKGATVIDVIGQVGFDPGTEWGTGLTSTADNTLRRKPTVEAGDPVDSDAFDPSIEWVGYATDTFIGLGAPYLDEVDLAPQVASTFPAIGAPSISLDANITINFNEAVTVMDPWFSLTCSNSGDHTATVSGSQMTFTLDPDADFVNGDTCTLTVLAANVSDNDTLDPPDLMEADFSTIFYTGDACQAGYTPVYAIQGSGLTAAIGGYIATKGVVVGDFEGSTGLGGFYLQDASGDADPATSDGIFVYTGSNNFVSAGQVVWVSGYARERFDQTTLNGSDNNSTTVPAANIVSCGTGSVAPTDVTMPFASIDFPERYEGMLVRLPQALVISEYFNYERFGEMVLALPLDGETRPFTPTSIDEPGSPALARAEANNLRRITLDDGLSIQNPNNVRHPNGANFSLSNTFRGGDTVQNTVGVLGYDFDLYRIQPTGPAGYSAVNPRPAAPEPVGGSLKVAAMNTLNYFLTPDNIQESSNAPDNPADNLCGPVPNLECRGWDGNQPLELTRQRDKLLAALAGLDADIIGLNELENTISVDPLGDPINGIVTGLNEMLGAGTYAYINTDVIGTDAIRVGLIYKPAKVMPVGAFKLLTSAVDPRFIDTLNRPVLAQTFEEVSTGARLTVAVNHLKSKGSDCNGVGDPDIGDGQGNCNQTRKAAAQALVDWLATDPTGSGDADYLIIGDLNSYAQEDPIDVIKAGPDDTPGTYDDYTNLISKYLGTYAYSYVFDGQAGYLDHALASPSLAAQVTGATEWHINADEPDLLDYDTSFKPPAQEAIYEPNAYRSSDHDPVLVGLNLIHFNFDGFFQPVDNLPTLNVVKAGSAIPVKFSLNGDQGLDIFALGYPISQQLACDTGAPLGELEQTKVPGVSELQYDPLTDEYTYVWKTEKGWASTCRQFVMVLDDGSIHKANFEFTK